MNSDSIDKYIYEGLNSGMFNSKPSFSGMREKLIPQDVQKVLSEQWSTPSRSDSKVGTRFVDKSTGQDWFVTGWDGKDTIATYTTYGIKNVSLQEMMNKNVVIDPYWDSETTLDYVKAVRPLQEYDHRSTNDPVNLFENMVAGLEDNVQIEEDSDEFPISVLYTEDNIYNDAASAVNMMVNRGSFIYEGTESVKEAYAFGFDEEWYVTKIEEGCSVLENEFILEIHEDVDSPTEDDLIELADVLPVPLINGINV